MRSIVIGFLVTAMAFVTGVVAVRSIIERTTLENISANTSSYDGKWVEFETYAQAYSLPDMGVYLGQPFEKREVTVVVESDKDLTKLGARLRKNSTEEEFNRVRVTARGVIQDDCAYLTCCFGQHVTLLHAEITPIGTIERYRLPIELKRRHNE